MVTVFDENNQVSNRSSPPRQRKCFYAIAGTAYRLTRGTVPATMLVRYRIWPFLRGRAFVWLNRKPVSLLEKHCRLRLVALFVI